MGAAAELVIGIDIGTGSSKGVLCRSDGTIVRQAQVPHTTAMPAPGQYEHDAETLWWNDFRVLLRDLLPEDAREVRAVCVSGIGPCVLPTDTAGTPLRPAILYGVDTRSAAVAARIEAELGGPEQLLERCGCVLSAQSGGPKLAWIRENEPEVWAATRRFFMAHNHIAFRLTGTYVLDHHSASQCAPLYDRTTKSWIPEWAAQLAPGLELPDLAWPSDIAGYVTADAARSTGLAEGTPVAVGTIDAWAEAHSVGVRRPGDLMLMYGSTMFFIGVTPEPVLSQSLWSTSGNFPGQHTLAGGMASSGSITSWFRDIAGGAPFEELLAEAAASPPGARGLLALPYFSGERTPVADPDARGVIAGLTLRHTRGEVYRSLLEATAFGVDHNLRAFRAAGFQPERMVAVGGGSAGSLWPQIVSDVTGLPQELPDVRVGASYGDAHFAAVAIGAASADSSWNRWSSTVRPGPHSAAYAELTDLFHELREATSAVQHRLSVLSRYQ